MGKGRDEGLDKEDSEASGRIGWPGDRVKDGGTVDYADGGWGMRAAGGADFLWG
jgi:hypothetical protein